MRICRPRAALLVVALGVAASACGSSSAKIDKLVQTLGSAAADPEQRTGAAVELVYLGKAELVASTLQANRSDAVMDVLLTRLAGDARGADPLAHPQPRQILAKDALADLRPVADDEQRAFIDEELTTWVTTSYVRRSQLGRHKGEELLAVLQGRAAPQMLVALKEILDQPADKADFVIAPQELLRGIALVGTAGITVLLDLAEGREGQGHRDETLGVRALQALHDVHADSRSDWTRLTGHVPQLERLAANPALPSAISDLALDTIGFAGQRHCLRGLANLARRGEERLVHRSLRKALECGGTSAIVVMAEALPEDREYDLDAMEEIFWGAIPVGRSASSAGRRLLSSSSWLGRLTGVKVLARTGNRSDVKALRKLESDTTPLRAHRGGAANGPSTSLGEVARQAADHLEKTQ
jgi:hypothetical protein